MRCSPGSGTLWSCHIAPVKVLDPCTGGRDFLWFRPSLDSEFLQAQLIQNLWNLLESNKMCIEHGAKLNLFPRSWRSKREIMAVNNRLGGRTMLCDPAGGRISANEQVEQTTDAQVSDEYPHRRFPKREHVHDNIDRPRWCPVGLTRSQKRWIQRLLQTEALEEERKEAPRRRVRSEVWRVKPKADDGRQSRSSVAPIDVATMLLPIQAVGSPNCS